jgi:hypothetical protein
LWSINQSTRILNRSLLVPKLGIDFLSKNITKILGHKWTLEASEKEKKIRFLANINFDTVNLC